MHAEKLPKEAPIQDMLRAWGLVRPPFVHEEKSGDLYATPSHAEALALLETTAALRGVMALTGAPGTGKSTLLKSWMRRLDPKRHLPLLVTHSSLTAVGVLDMLLAKLGERPRLKRSANLLMLENHLADIQPVLPVLALDDAQNYPAPALEEVRLLLGLGARQRSAFALVLLGDEYLLASLRLSVQRALFSRISAAATLGPLPRQEIAPYLNWHVSRAGLDREIFAPASLDLLAEASQGNPRTLNLLAQAAWIAAARSGGLSIQPEHVHAALPQVPAANTKIIPA